MNGFLITKRKTMELVLLMVLDLVLYIVTDFDFVILFTFGFIWNWVASQEEVLPLHGKKQRFSTMKMVVNLQRLVMKPLGKMPQAVKIIAKILPAGLFWWGVVVFNDSQMPWWAVFIGSLCLELVILETKLFMPAKENTP